MTIIPKIKCPRYNSSKIYKWAMILMAIKRTNVKYLNIFSCQLALHHFYSYIRPLPEPLGLITDGTYIL